jgi:hypothetical protein
MSVPAPIPVILFAYARPAHVARALAALKRDRVPLLYVFADGAKGEADSAAVAQTRALLRTIDWCEVLMVERAENLGLGRNVLAGVTDIAARHEAFIVWEDDLVAAPGTYAWLCAALRHYSADETVFSVTGWTHPRVTPPDVGGAPYFDARAESWSWGAYARSWRGMNEETALQKLAAARARGVSPETCGADLPEMARDESVRNLWAVRWLYHHLQHGGLCLRPPVSLVDHGGFDASATNAIAADGWQHAALPEAAPRLGTWPVALENTGCRDLWRRAAPTKWRRRWQRLVKLLAGGA